MRILLYFGMQLAILLTVGIISMVLLNLFNIRISQGSYLSMLLFCAVMGCVGSLISLMMSKTICKSSYRIKIIGVPVNGQERFLLNTVRELAAKADLPMPEVGIYESNEPNAFATGSSKNSALVAVSTGLLNSMSENEVKGVLGHELTHVKNGDMVTMCLLQGVLNTFVYFFAYLISIAIVNVMRGQRNNDEESSSFSFGDTLAYHSISMILQLILGIGANMLLMWFSRWREFRADAGSAGLAGKYNMIDALKALQRCSSRNYQNERQQSGYMEAMCINSNVILGLFASHPPLEKRIEALMQLN